MNNDQEQTMSGEFKLPQPNQILTSTKPFEVTINGSVVGFSGGQLFSVVEAVETTQTQTSINMVMRFNGNFNSITFLCDGSMFGYLTQEEAEELRQQEEIDCEPEHEEDPHAATHNKHGEYQAHLDC